MLNTKFTRIANYFTDRLMRPGYMYVGGSKSFETYYMQEKYLHFEWINYSASFRRIWLRQNDGAAVTVWWCHHVLELITWHPIQWTVVSMATLVMLWLTPALHVFFKSFLNRVNRVVRTLDNVKQIRHLKHSKSSVVDLYHRILRIASFSAFTQETHLGAPIVLSDRCIHTHCVHN